MLARFRGHLSSSWGRCAVDGASSIDRVNSQVRHDAEKIDKTQLVAIPVSLQNAVV
jgi:hypothetical protein